MGSKSKTGSTGSQINSSVGTVSQTSLSGVWKALTQLIRVTAVGHIESTGVLRGAMNIVETMLVRESDAWLNAYQAYFNAFDELVACAAFESASKTVG